MPINLLFLLIFIAINVQAQYNHQDVLLGQSGQSLIVNLENDYKPHIILDYDRARDTLFSKVYAVQDTVTCVYSGHQLYLNPAFDPSASLHNGGIANGINTEHTYPQSKGASIGNARSDMHHLYPVRSSVNSARSNHPYGEVNDQETDRWFYKTLAEVNPSQDKDWYSELDLNNPRFEPREDHKGNVARAVFYFYTMYKQEADAADPAFFAKQVPTLCQWHLSDPVDSLEWERTWRIAHYQEGKPNPFVLDCTLPQRTYCPHLPVSNCITNIKKIETIGVQLHPHYPNPARNQSTIHYDLEQTASVTLIVYNALGQMMWQVDFGEQYAGTHFYELDASQWTNGLYTYRMVFEQNEQRQSLSKKLLLVR